MMHVNKRKWLVTAGNTFLPQCVAGLLLSVLTVSAATVYTNDTDWAGQDWTLEDGDVIAGVHTNVGHFSVPAGVTVTVYPFDPVSVNFGRVAVFAQSTAIDGTLSANAAGYPYEEGPGAGSGRTGAGYGGRGSYGNYYGDPWTPDLLGSGGGHDSSYPSGGSGGGAILIDSTGAVVVEGIISANGQNGTGRSGGGSGGSLWLRAASIAGSGTVAADGGSASTSFASGSGGGRIAFDTAQNDFRGIIRAKAGPASSARIGRSGTYNFQSDPNLDLVITNDIALPPGTNWVFSSLTVKDDAIFEIQSTPGTVELDYADEIASRVTILNELTVEAGSVLSADGQGYWTQEGLGHGTDRSGAAYGGRGGSGGRGEPGDIYGSADTPDRLGSGGGDDGSGNAGGGALIMDVGGTLTVEGTLSANGARGTYRTGGGSGGSLWLKTAVLAGKGTISSDGGLAGDATYAGGGGGGRIAIETAQNNFDGILRAEGKPSSSESGRAGTLNFQSDPDKDLVIEYDIALPPGTNWVFRSITVRNDATFEVQSVPGTAAVDYADEVASRIHILGDLTVATNSALSADGLGYLVYQGPGAGSGSGTGSGGGGYGGSGGAGTMVGGGVYGSALTPNRLGSGGGYAAGSSGGGALILDIDGTLTVTGRISADGESRGGRKGGGSGGSIWINTAVITGMGDISAEGGDSGSDYRGGGGGGGRIALTTRSDRLTGEMPGTYIEYAGSANGRISVNGGSGGDAEDGTPGTFHFYVVRGTLFMMR